MKIFLKMLLAVAAGLLAPRGVLAQTARILRFEPAVMEIDTVRYDAGPVNVRFVCTNICDKDVSIVDVHSQCGCAKPSFSRAVIAPGKQGYVDVVLNPEHLFAEQTRHLTVIATNGDYRKYNTITIHGYVDRGVTVEEIRYPYELAPGLRSDVQMLGMRLSKRGEVSEKEFSIYNDTDNVMALGWKSPCCKAGRVHVWADVPYSVMPHSGAKIRVSVDTRNIPTGPYVIPLFLYVDGQSAVVLLKGAVVDGAEHVDTVLPAVSQ